MFEDEVLEQFLENAADNAKKQIKESGILTVENAIPLLLKSQYNHIMHLEERMVTKDEFRILEGWVRKIDTDLNKTKDELKWWIMFGVGLLAIFIPVMMGVMLRFFGG